MSLLTFLSFVLYSFVTSVTPGPNNIMLAASGVNFGFKKSIPHILGIGFGFGLMVSIVGLGIGTILSTNKNVFEILKIIGIAYLLYLAYKIFISSELDTNSKKTRPLTFLEAALFQWVNPKAWIMAMGAVTTYLSPSSSILSYLFIGLVYGLVGIPSTGVWAYIGEKLKVFIDEPRKLKLFNTVMAILLVISVINPLIESFNYIYFVLK